MHLVPAMVLVSGAFGVLVGAEALTPLLALELFAGGAYLLLLIPELRRQRAGHVHHGAIDWLEVAAAAILGLEAWHIAHRHHVTDGATGQAATFHALPWLYAAVAVAYLALAFGWLNLHGRRFLALDATGIRARLQPFGKSQVIRWDELTAAEAVGENAVRLSRRSGPPVTLSFAHVADGHHHRTTLLQCARAAGVPAAREG